MLYHYDYDLSVEFIYNNEIESVSSGVHWYSESIITSMYVSILPTYVGECYFWNGDKGSSTKVDN